MIASAAEIVDRSAEILQLIGTLDVGTVLDDDGSMLRERSMKLVSRCAEIRDRVTERRRSWRA